MSEDEGNFIEFADAEVDDVAAAVQGVLVGLRAPWLREGAEQTMAQTADQADPGPQGAALRFVTLLELAYLVASADGLAKVERESLSYLLENLTGAAVKQSDLERHFSDLDQAVAAFGRRERLAASAAAIEEDGREETMLLVSLIAMADGNLSNPEMGSLVELGEHMARSREQVEALAHQAAGYVQEALR